jgi:hypothetical protein
MKFHTRGKGHEALDKLAEDGIYIPSQLRSAIQSLLDRRDACPEEIKEGFVNNIDEAYRQAATCQSAIFMAVVYAEEDSFLLRVNGGEPMYFSLGRRVMLSFLRSVHEGLTIRSIRLKNRNLWEELKNAPNKAADDSISQKFDNPIFIK